MAAPTRTVAPAGNDVPKHAVAPPGKEKLNPSCPVPFIFSVKLITAGLVVSKTSVDSMLKPVADVNAASAETVPT